MDAFLTLSPLFLKIKTRGGTDFLRILVLSSFICKSQTSVRASPRVSSWNLRRGGSRVWPPFTQESERRGFGCGFGFGGDESFELVGFAAIRSGERV